MPIKIDDIFIARNLVFIFINFPFFRTFPTPMTVGNKWLRRCSDVSFWLGHKFLMLGSHLQFMRAKQWLN